MAYLAGMANERQFLTFLHTRFPSLPEEDTSLHYIGLHAMLVGGWPLELPPIRHPFPRAP
jgi:hypothetical protein